MGAISTKSIDQPDETVSASRVTKRIVTVGKTAMARIECQPGWRWSRDISPPPRPSVVSTIIRELFCRDAFTSPRMKAVSGSLAPAMLLIFFRVTMPGFLARNRA